MLEQLTPTPEDPILRTIDMYRKDPRADKIDVGVGVFKDTRGATPVMRAVREAEMRLHQEQDTKTYVGMAGDEQFNDSIGTLVFGDTAARSRVRAPAGSTAYSEWSLITAAVVSKAKSSTDRRSGSVNSKAPPSAAWTSDNVTVNSDSS